MTVSGLPTRHTAILSNYEGVQQESEVGGNYVYRFDPATGDLSVVAG